MNYAVETGSGTIIYIPSFIKIVTHSKINSWVTGTHTQIAR
jgi:hypothetical protein